MTAAPREQASVLIQKVDAAFEAAQGAWTGVGVSLGSLVGVTPQNQVLSAIRQMKSLGRDPWAARADKLAASDQDGWTRWVQDGNDLLHNLATTAQDAEYGSLPGIVAQTVTATKQDVQAVAKTAWSFRWGFVALAAAAVLIIWKVRV